MCEFVPWHIGPIITGGVAGCHDERKAAGLASTLGEDGASGASGWHSYLLVPLNAP